MKKIIILFIAGTLLLNVVSAQEKSKKWTFQECITYALEHNIQIKQKSIQQENAKNNLNTAEMSRLPDLNAGVNQNWSFGRSNNNQLGIYEDRQTSNSNMGIYSSLPVFTGFRINNEIRQKKLNFEAATYGLQKVKDDISMNVASLFLQVLFSKEILTVNQEQLQLSTNQMNRISHLVNVGKVSQSQLYDIKAQVAKDEVSVTQASNDLQLALLDLAQNIEIQDIKEFDIKDPDTEEIMEGNLKSLQLPDDIYKNAIIVKPIIKEHESLLESSKSGLKIAKSFYYPKLDLDMQYNNSYFYNYGRDNIGFSEQFKNNGGEVIGLKLNIPIFNRFQIRNQVRNARLDVQNQQLTFENIKKSLYKEIQTAYYNALGSMEKYKASLRAVEAGKESFKHAQERYEAGKSTVFEFDEAKNRLIQSMSEQIRAKYDYIFRNKILDFYNGIDINL